MVGIGPIDMVYFIASLYLCCETVDTRDLYFRFDTSCVFTSNLLFDYIMHATLWKEQSYRFFSIRYSCCVMVLVS